jgi:outer membrane protein insertion porin family
MRIAYFLLFCFFFTLPVSAADEIPETTETFHIFKIQIVGNRLVLDDEILKVINSREGSPFDRDLITEDLKNIYQMGYFQKNHIEAQPVKDDEGNIIVEYRIKENPIIRDLIIYGGESIADVDAYKIFVDLVGKPENTKLLTEKIRSLESQYLDAGYIVARVKDINLDNSGTLRIYIDEGKIDSIVFTGNHKTKESYLRHIVSSVHEDEAYNERSFARDFRRLQGTGYFSNVSRAVRPSEDTDSEGYILEIQLQEKKTSSIGLGAGINSSAGLFGSGNATIGDLRGKGETLGINAMFGSGYGANSTFSRNQGLYRRGNIIQIGARYSIPYFADTEGTASLYSNYSRGPNFMLDLVRQTSLDSGVSYSSPLDTDGNNVLRFSTNFNNVKLDDRDHKKFIERITKNIMEDIGLDESAAKEKAENIRKKQLKDGSYLGFGGHYLFKDLDSDTKPRDGWRTRLGVEPAVSFGDINSFTKLSGSVTKYIPAWQSSTFVFNVRTGFELFGNIPQFSLFRLGGLNGVRGYRPFSDLGLGTKMAIAMAEYRTPLYNIIPPIHKVKFMRNLDFALFADGGLIRGNRAINTYTKRLNDAASVGFGFRVHMPVVGGLRVDMGFPLIKTLFKNPSLFGVNFGPADYF